jgi:acyl dehydratase
LTLGTTVANLGFEKIAFPNPVFHGDTIWVETEVTSARASNSRPEVGIVAFEHRAYNQDDTLVCSAIRSAMMRRRPDGVE